MFEEVAEARGLRFVTHSSRSERRYQPETMVAGVALFDYDNDGWLDVYAVNGAPIDDAREERAPTTGTACSTTTVTARSPT